MLINHKYAALGISMLRIISSSHILKRETVTLSIPMCYAKYHIANGYSFQKAINNMMLTYVYIR
jgi:hypothetical protein